MGEGPISAKSSFCDALFTESGYWGRKVASLLSRAKFGDRKGVIRHFSAHRTSPVVALFWTRGHINGCSFLRGGFKDHQKHIAEVGISISHVWECLGGGLTVDFGFFLRGNWVMRHVGELRFGNLKKQRFLRDCESLRKVDGCGLCYVFMGPFALEELATIDRKM